MINLVRDYWNSRPCNLYHSSQAIGTRAYFDDSRNRKFFVEPHLPIFADYHKYNGLRVLDIGCGLGLDSVQFALAGAQVTAVDLSSKSLDLAKKRADCNGVRIQFIEADMEYLPSVLPAQPYDLIWSWGAIHHTPNPERALKALLHYADCTTELRLMLYHRYSTKAIGQYLRHPRWSFDESVALQSEAQFGCPVTHTYTKNSARNLFHACGWETVDIQIRHIFPWKIKDYVLYRYVLGFPWNIVPSSLFRFLEQHIGWHLLIKARRSI